MKDCNRCARRRPGRGRGRSDLGPNISSDGDRAQRVWRATHALSIYPSAGYTLFSVFVQILLLFTVYVSNDTHIHIHVVTYLTMIF
jgi:hypothetical protein